MTFHLFGNPITARGVAANNRGETEGNRTTLPKVFWGDKLHVSVSAEAIRWAMRYYWQMMEIEVNRYWIEEEQDFKWILQEEKAKIQFDPNRFIDDDVMGYMDAKPGKGKELLKRRGALEVTRAVSLESAEKIEITFNSKSGSKGKKGSQDAEAEKSRVSIYSTETITTRFQYGMAITPQCLKQPARIIDVLNAATKLANVGGNQARFLFDFSPESAIFRWTHHPVPQFLHCFEQPEADILAAPRLSRLIECEEIPAAEVWIFGGYAFTEEAEALKQKGANVYPSIRKGVEALTE
ncbi:MAG: type I-B CRISPR-associated protein Cas7/Cst2/DevR, partial [Cyanobacteriota bacterium]|nr:type I-B CRISPR-associated protein Cas7/Cst2/DevR [Cyanobacteriota bacterium]